MTKWCMILSFERSILLGYNFCQTCNRKPSFESQSFPFFSKFLSVINTWNKLQGKHHPIQHEGTDDSSSIPYFVAISCLIFDELTANQQNPPSGPKILMGVEIKQHKHPWVPISQQQFFSSFVYLRPSINIAIQTKERILTMF